MTTMNKLAITFFTCCMTMFSVAAPSQPLIAIPYTTPVYTAAQTDQAIAESSGGGGTVKAKHVAMFIIKMNETPSTTRSSAYTQFELKASTNNFDSALSLDKRCVYYVHSGHADQFDIESNDKARLFINHNGTDNRSYVKIANTLTDSKITSYAPESIIVIIDTTQCWSGRSDGKWLNSEDDNLTWTYVRTKNGTQETDPGTAHPLWRPIAPVKWLSEVPSWAK